MKRSRVYGMIGYIYTVSFREREVLTKFTKIEPTRIVKTVFQVFMINLVYRCKDWSWSSRQQSQSCVIGDIDAGRCGPSSHGDDGWRHAYDRYGRPLTRVQHRRVSKTRQRYIRLNFFLKLLCFATYQSEFKFPLALVASKLVKGPLRTTKYEKVPK